MRNAFAYVSRSAAQDIFYLFKGPDQCYPVLKFGDNCSCRDMAPKKYFYRAVTLKGQGHL